MQYLNFDKHLGCFGQKFKVLVVNAMFLPVGEQFSTVILILTNICSSLTCKFWSLLQFSPAIFFLGTSFFFSFKIYLNKFVYFLKNILFLFNKLKNLTNLYFLRRGPRPFGLARHTHEQVLHISYIYYTYIIYIWIYSEYIWYNSIWQNKKTKYKFLSLYSQRVAPGEGGGRGGWGGGEIFYIFNLFEFDDILFLFWQVILSNIDKFLLNVFWPVRLFYSAMWFCLFFKNESVLTFAVCS